IEALKPAIEACGISTLSQSPMLGFHKQMDNRIKLLEEILSFRMQGVEFDNGDMYVDGHKAASDVRDEFVSVTEKLMDELAQCYNVLPQLDIIFPPTATKEIQYLNAKGALTYTDIAGDPVLYGNLPPREISMKDVFRSG